METRFDHLMGKTTKHLLIGVGIAGLVVYFLIAMVVVEMVHVWRAAQRAGNEAATIQNLKTILAVETQYYMTHDQSFDTLKQLVAERLLSKKFDGEPATADGYVLTLRLISGTRELPSSCVLTADPLDPNDPSNHFYVDSVSGQIHVNPDKPAGRDDPLLEDSRRVRSIVP